MANKTTISGNIGKGEVRVTPSGKTVCNFSIADQFGFGDNAKTQWWECSLWGKRAENPKLTDLLVKGTRITVIGEAELIPAGDYPAKLKLFVQDILQIDAKQSQSTNQTPDAQGRGDNTPQGGFDTDEFDGVPF
ncbi:MAG: single-stranded DNA-binding protein [Ignavibacteriaceae bacterium]|nr:single-stranded DNA-binding protein [Ignavibacteriaceae bacterium]